MPIATFQTYRATLNKKKIFFRRTLVLTPDKNTQISIFSPTIRKCNSVGFLIMYLTCAQLANHTSSRTAEETGFLKILEKISRSNLPCLLISLVSVLLTPISPQNNNNKDVDLGTPPKREHSLVNTLSVQDG